MTRIALVASSYLPHLGGVEEHVFHLAGELARRGHEVTVWTVDRGEDPLPHTSEAPVRRLPTPMPSRSVGGMLRWALRFPAAARSWRRAARADRPQVIVIQCFGANGPYALALARCTGTPLVYSNHGETFMDAHGTFETSALMRRALGRTLAAAAVLTSCSAYAAGDLARFGSIGAPLIVGNGIDLDAPGAALDTSLPDRYIAGVGRLVGNKGFDRLVAAFADATGRDGLAGVGLVIAGDGPERGRLEELAVSLGVRDRVHFTGPLPREQVRTLLDGALAHVVPSLIEAFGIVVLEGWRSGVPVIATGRGGPPEFVTDGVDGILVDPDDIAGLSRHLVAVVHDEHLRRRLGAAGRAAAARFSWASVADSYEAAFDRALPHARPDRTRSAP